MKIFSLKEFLNIITPSFLFSFNLEKISKILISFSMRLFIIILIVYLFKNILFLLISGSLKTLRKTSLRRNRLESLLRVAKDFINYFSYFLILVLILVNLGVDLKSLFISFGVLGLIISLSLQSLFWDIIEGFYIVFEDRFKIGDRIKVNNIEGIVKDFNLRRTIIIDDEGNFHRIPNSQIKMISLIKKNY